jgi:hypothetical protein
MGLARSTLRSSYSDMLSHLITRSGGAQSRENNSIPPLSFCYGLLFVPVAREVSGGPGGIRAVGKHHEGAQADSADALSVDQLMSRNDLWIWGEVVMLIQGVEYGLIG